MSDRQYKRKNFLIDKRFQLRFIASFLFLVVISLFVFSGGLFGYYWIRYMAGENVFSEFVFIQKQVRIVNEDGEVTGTVSEMQPPINPIELILPPILINNIVIMVIIAVIGVFYSHRIAGPIYRIEKDLARILDGEKGVRIQTRKRDIMKSLVDKINRLADLYESGK